MDLTHTLHEYAKRLKQYVRFDPLRDWFVLLTFFGVAFVGILAWNTWAFQTVTDGGVIGSVRKEVTTPAFDSESLEAVRSALDARSAEEMNYKTGAYYFNDPSQ